MEIYYKNNGAIQSTLAKKYDGKLIDYEFSSRKGKNIIYFHFQDDDSTKPAGKKFTHTLELFKHINLIDSVCNYFEGRNGKDYIELYYRAFKEPDTLHYFIYGDTVFINTRLFQLLNGSINKDTLRKRKEIIN